MILVVGLVRDICLEFGDGLEWGGILEWGGGLECAGSCDLE